MARAKLTNSAVEKFECRIFESGEHKGEVKPQDTLWCGELKGFGLRLSLKTGARTYIFCYRVKGTKKETYVTIGRHNDPWRVDQARTMALKLKAQMLSGVDPVEEEIKRCQAKLEQETIEAALGTTLRTVLSHYLEHKRTKHGALRPATKKDIVRHCDKNMMEWLDQPVAHITRDKCLAKFTELSQRSPQQANACMIYLRALLNHARELHATEDGQFPILAANPVTRLFKLIKPNPEQPSDTRIPLDKVGACWNWLRKRSADARNDIDQCAADWLTFIMLTGCRRNESGSLKWSDLDFDKRTFTLRGEVVKNHTALTLPMSTAMHELLSSRKSPAPVTEKVARRRRVTRAVEYVFPSNGRKTPYIVQAQSVVAKLSEISGTHIHVLALRRTFEDIATECKIDSDQRRLLINHKGDVHSRHYANNRKALVGAVETIATWIIDQAAIAEAMESGANVMRFRGKTAL